MVELGWQQMKTEQELAEFVNIIIFVGRLMIERQKPQATLIRITSHCHHTLLQPLLLQLLAADAAVKKRSRVLAH